MKFKMYLYTDLSPSSLTCPSVKSQTGEVYDFMLKSESEKSRGLSGMLENGRMWSLILLPKLTVGTVF